MSSAAAGDFLGTQEQPFWRDHQLFRVNAIRTKTLIERTALMIVRFGDKYEHGVRRLMPVTVPRLASPVSPCMLKVVCIR